MDSRNNPFQVNNRRIRREEWAEEMRKRKERFKVINAEYKR